VIKVCGITSQEDAQAALDAGANALGFNFYPRSPRYVAPLRAQQIAQTVTGRYLRVGVFVNPTEEDLIEAASAVPLDILQLHGRHVPTHLAGSFRIWQAIRASDIPEHDRGIEAFLMDSPTPLYGGSGESFDWTLAAAFPYRAIIAGGLDEANVAAAIQIGKPWGVDACSRLESRPGKKDHRRVRAFVQAAQAAFKLLPQEAAK
jgi:phosphoribosylanthranilate isomerase